MLNRIIPCWVIALTLLSLSPVSADPAEVSSIAPQDLVEFEHLSEPVKQLIENALLLTTKNLTYQFGSNSPENHGMDCSGTVQFTLQASGVAEVPRSSHTIYLWAEEQGTLNSTRGVESIDDPVFETLRPGDLLFWEGTYDTAKRNPPISHVMIYLGRLKADGQGVTFGSSDGRHFRRKRNNGVSVFDWKMPRPGSTSKFVAFGRVPGLVSEPLADEVGDEEKERPVVGSLKSVLEKLFKKPEASP